MSAKEPTPQIFRAGDPVNRHKEAFIPRQSVLGELETQITLSNGCPGLILYERRWTGKSTLLQNLDGFLPASVCVTGFSMLNPNAFTSLDHFISSVSRAIQSALDVEASPGKMSYGLPGLYEVLTACDHTLQAFKKRLLLTIDEYEGIDKKIGQGVFVEDLLDVIRESIQTHRQLTWIFAGSHQIAELSHADWTSYLVSARTIEMPLFSEAETRLLLTEPLYYSSAWARDDPERLRFDPALWGEGGIEHIHAEAAGWPHLVQLIAETAVDILNDSKARQLNARMLEQVSATAIIRGDNALRRLIVDECSLPGEWDYLRRFRSCDAQPTPDDETVCWSLKRRLLVTEMDGQWYLRVPLMQRWLRERG